MFYVDCVQKNLNEDPGEKSWCIPKTWVVHPDRIIFLKLDPVPGMRIRVKSRIRIRVKSRIRIKVKILKL
jgi:hypothetical protein